jgi:hypothetical protein
VPITGGATGIQFIRFTEVTSQAQDAGLCGGSAPTASGCAFLDSTELSLYGASTS